MASKKVKVPFMNGLKTAHKHSKEDFDHIRQWIILTPHLPPISDDFIHMFLHTNQCQLERTKSNIEHFFTIRTHAPELFDNWDPFLPPLQRTLDNTVSCRTSVKTPEGYSVMFSRLSDSDTSKFDLMSMIKLFFMQGDTMVSDDGLIAGYINVFDMKGISIGHLAAVNLSVVKTFLNYIQEGTCIKVVEVHVVNAVSFMDRVMSLIKPFMKSELYNMLKIHSTIEPLKKLFPLDVIPCDYGGTGKDSVILHAECRKEMETTFLPFFKEITSLKVDESKRQGKSGGGQKLFGAEGSFRSLSID